MKSISNLFSLLLLISMICSCKKDDPIVEKPTSFRDELLHFNVDFGTDSYTATHNQDGYINNSYAFDFDTASFTDWTVYSNLTDTIDYSAEISIISSKRKSLGEEITLDDLRELFSPGTHPFTSDSIDGVSVAFSVGINSSYSSRIGDQTGSSFSVIDTITITDVQNPYFKIKVNFNCMLYEQAGTQSKITSGEVVCKFEPSN